MTLGRLVRRQMMQHPVRSLLTVGAVTVAMFLFCFIRSVLTSLDAAVKSSASNRIIVSSAVSLFQVLPRSYRDAIERIEGVASVSRFSWFGAVYRDEGGFFAQFACEPEILLQQYTEIDIDPAERDAWFQDRRGAIIGRELADKYGWEVGDTIPLVGTIYPRTDGSEWTFDVRGIYESRTSNVDELTMYFHTAYLEEAQAQGDAEGPRGPGVLLVKIADGYRGEEVAARIDAYYDGGPQRTRTQTEAAFQAGFINMLGNLPAFLGAIVGAILVAILFGVVNTMTIAARERTRSMGIVKAMGFPNAVPARLFLFEALLLVGLGTAAGLALAWVTQVPFRKVVGTQVPNYAVAPETFILAGLMALALALLAGGVPAIRAARLRPVEAFRSA